MHIVEQSIKNGIVTTTYLGAMGPYTVVRAAK
jgi:hypothetical protein